MIPRTKDVVNFNSDNIPILKEVLDKIQRDAATNVEVNALALQAATTVDFDPSMTSAEMQDLIDAQPKNLNGFLLTFQFADGTYTISSTLVFDYFYGGRIYLLGNGTESNALHTNQAVILDGSALGDNVIEAYDCCLTTLYWLAIKSNSAAGYQGIWSYSCKGLFVVACYILGNGTTDGYGISAGACFAQIFTTYVSNMKYGISANRVCQLYSEGNDDTGTMPFKGLYAALGATIVKYSTQPDGSDADEHTTDGGVIR